jgi:DNA-binding MarR family transcriptional regulator
MNYQELAIELLSKMQSMHKIMHQKNIQERMQGEALIRSCISEHYQESIIPKEISNTMGVSPARIAAALNDLENKGLITREIDAEDRRKILVRLTEKGQSVAEESKGDFLQKMAALLSLLGEHDAKEYVRIMGRLADEISKINL